MKRKINILQKIRPICVNCGKFATKGILQKPYCKKCFKKIFKNEKEYFMTLE